MTHSTLPELHHIANTVTAEGWAVTPSVVEPQLLADVVQDLSRIPAAAGIRNLLDLSPSVRELARHRSVRHIPEQMLGMRCFVARAILFDKTPDCNWKVPWHQDLTIAVRERVEVPGFKPWSIKEGVHHVQPPVEVLQRMVTVRVHLDDCGVGNGPVRVISRSHVHGTLSPTAADELRKATPEVVCTVARGGLLAFMPLLLHASSPSTVPCRRRVAHFEFAVDALPGGLEWAVQWA